MSVEKVEKLIKDNKVEFVDLRFVDMRGVQQHVTFPASIVEASLFEDGKMFDGSSIAGWKGINESDMVLLPDADTAVLDPFCKVWDVDNLYVVDASFLPSSTGFNPSLTIVAQGIRVAEHLARDVLKTSAAA